MLGLYFYFYKGISSWMKGTTEVKIWDGYFDTWRKFLIDKKNMGVIERVNSLQRKRIGSIDPY
jgi:hypothetical protein